MNAPIIEWSKQYEVGIRFMDGQHQQMLDLVNQVLEGAHQGKELDELVAVLRDLVRLTEHHFHAEETRMVELGADAEHHRRLVDGRRNLQRFADVDRRVLEDVHVGRDPACAGDVDHVPIGLGARHILGREIADRADSVLDDD